jgi:hypothetical protein
MPERRARLTARTGGRREGAGLQFSRATDAELAFPDPSSITNGSFGKENICILSYWTWKGASWEI